MGARLISDHVGYSAAAHELRQNVCGVPDEPYREGDPLRARFGDPRDRTVETRRLSVAVAGGDAPVDARFVHLHTEECPAVHGGGERLRTPHPPEPGAEHEPTGQRSAKVLSANRAKGLVRSLEDSLRPDVDPRPGGHLSIHHEAGALELAKMIPGRPAADEVAVGDQDPRRADMRAKHADGLTTLNQERLIAVERPKGRNNGIERRPAPGRAARSTINNQIAGTLCHVRVEIVHKHAKGRFLLPSLA